MHVLLFYNCILTVVKYTDMLCYVIGLIGSNSSRWLKATDNNYWMSPVACSLVQMRISLLQVMSEQA